jgi:hypothetical protein
MRFVNHVFEQGWRDNGKQTNTAASAQLWNPSRGATNWRFFEILKSWVVVTRL